MITSCLRWFMIAMLVAGGCSSPPAVDPEGIVVQVRQLKMVPFTVVTSSVGCVGTLIRMERNEQLGDVVERTVFAPVDCLTSATHPTPETFPAARPAAIVKVRVESTSKRGLTLQLSGKLVDIGSTIGATSDWKYDLEFVDPSVQEIGEVLAESFIETMKVECRRKLEDPGNILICKVLMATGIRYTFTTDKRLSLDASASVLKQKLSAEGADTSVADGSITVTAPPGQKFMLGYLAWKMSAGAPGSKGQGGVLSVSETEDLKRSVLGR